MGFQAVNFQEKLGLFDEHWTPKIIAQMNDYQFKLVKIHGGFVWHSHSETDEVFIVLAGEMAIEFRNGRQPLNLLLPPTLQMAYLLCLFC